MQPLAQTEISFNTSFRQEVEAVNVVKVAANSVDATEPLNQADRIPMQVVVNDLVTVLKVETFGEHIGCNDRVKFRFSSRKLVFGICHRCEPADHPRLAFVATEDHLKLVPLYVGLEVLEQISGCICILGKDQPLSSFEWFLFQSPHECLQFCVLLRLDWFQERGFFPEYGCRDRCALGASPDRSH